MYQEIKCPGNYWENVRPLKPRVVDPASGLVTAAIDSGAAVIHGGMDGKIKGYQRWRMCFNHTS